MGRYCQAGASHAHALSALATLKTSNGSIDHRACSLHINPCSIADVAYWRRLWGYFPLLQEYRMLCFASCWRLASCNVKLWAVFRKLVASPWCWCISGVGIFLGMLPLASGVPCKHSVIRCTISHNFLTLYHVNHMQAPPPSRSSRLDSLLADVTIATPVKGTQTEFLCHLRQSHDPPIWVSLCQHHFPDQTQCAHCVAIPSTAFGAGIDF